MFYENICDVKFENSELTRNVFLSMLTSLISIIELDVKCSYSYSYVILHMGLTLRFTNKCANRAMHSNIYFTVYEKKNRYSKNFWLVHHIDKINLTKSNSNRKIVKGKVTLMEKK